MIGFSVNRSNNCYLLCCDVDADEIAVNEPRNGCRKCFTLNFSKKSASLISTWWRSSSLCRIGRWARTLNMASFDSAISSRSWNETMTISFVLSAKHSIAGWIYPFISHWIVMFDNMIDINSVQRFSPCDQNPFETYVHHSCNCCPFILLRIVAFDWIAKAFFEIVAAGDVDTIIPNRSRVRVSCDVHRCQCLPRFLTRIESVDENLFKERMSIWLW